MIRYGIIATVLLLLAVAVTATFREGDPVDQNANQVVAITGQGDLQQRVMALEAAVLEERQLRLELEATLASLVDQGLVASQSPSLGTSRLATSAANVEGLPGAPQTVRAQVAERRNDADTDPGDRQMERLVDAGFDEYRAADIVRRQEELQMQLLNARFAANQGGERVNLAELQLQATEDLKTTLGEADYEKYLQATRQSTSVDIRNVLASSPAESAGLQVGDEIVSYGGQRVYNIAELNRMANSGNVSGNVVVEVMRNGQRVSLSIPPGPMGITGGRGGGF